MAWPRLEDDYLQHPKIRALPPLAVLLDMSGILYCSRNLTDGVILRNDLAAVMPAIQGPRKWAERLVDGGRWERTPDGYSIHDYLVYNPPRSRVLAKRAKDSTRKAGGIPRGIHAESEVPHTQDPVPTVVELPGSDHTLSAVGNADAPNGNGKVRQPIFDGTMAHLLGRIIKERPAWKGTLTPGAVVKLAQTHGGRPVVEALEELSLRVRDGVRVKDPYPYFEAMCKPDGDLSSAGREGN